MTGFEFQTAGALVPSWEAGDVIGKLVREGMTSGKEVTVSFVGVNDVPSPFVNAAFVTLLNHFTFDQIRAQLRVKDSTRQINEMILSRIKFEAHRKAS